MHMSPASKKGSTMEESVAKAFNDADTREEHLCVELSDERQMARLEVPTGFSPAKFWSLAVKEKLMEVVELVSSISALAL